MTQTLERTSIEEAEAAYLDKLHVESWGELHDDAQADFRAGFGAGLAGVEQANDAIAQFAAGHSGDPMLDLRVEDFTGGFRAGAAVVAAGE